MTGWLTKVTFYHARVYCTTLEMLVRRAGAEDVASQRPITIDFDGHTLAGSRPSRAYGVEGGKWVFTVALVDTSYGDLG